MVTVTLLLSRSAKEAICSVLSTLIILVVVVEGMISNLSVTANVLFSFTNPKPVERSTTSTGFSSAIKASFLARSSVER